MNTTAKVGIVIGLLAVIGVTLAIKQRDRTAVESAAETPGSLPDAARPVSTGPMTAGDADGQATGSSDDRSSDERSSDERPSSEPNAAEPSLPRLVDLGADKCIPCKQMAPILAAMEKEFAGRMEVEFIDVWKIPSAGELYGVRMIPTQIFYDASGKERFRHEGFFSRQDILSKWKELGVELGNEPVPAVVGEVK